MNANDLISADLLPRNVPKPSSFHENTLRPEVPEVSLMFDNGLQSTKSNGNNKQALLEKSNMNSMRRTCDNTQERESPGLSDPTEYQVQDLLQKHTKNVPTPNRPRSKPSTLNQIKHNDKLNSVKSSSDELEFPSNNRHSNKESHLNEPVESYSVWKYKNQHMFNKDVEQVNQSDNVQHVDDKKQDYDVRETKAKSHYKINYPQSLYEQQQQQQQHLGMSYNHRFFVQDEPIQREDHLRYTQGHHISSEKYIQKRNNQYRVEEEYLENKKHPSKPNWRTGSPQSEIFGSVPRYNEVITVQNRQSDDNNTDSRMCKIVEFQTKHIEFLNEQIYNLTLQNKTLSNLTKNLKTLEESQNEQFEFLKKNLDSIHETLLNLKVDNKENNLPLSNMSSPTHKKNLTESKKVENHLEKIEQKLINLINSKLKNIHTTEDQHVNQCPQINQVLGSENETSCEETIPSHTDKQCTCACDKTNHQPVNKKKPTVGQGTKNEQRSPQHNQIDLMKHNGQSPKNWEVPEPSKQVVNSKKLTKKIPKRIEDQIVMNPPAMVKPGPAPIMYYQPDKFTQASRKSCNQRQKNNVSLDDKHGTRHKKMLKSKGQHVKRNYLYRPESTLMNEEHSLTLNARELPVINEHIPSPEASVHIDMGEYQSSSSEYESDQDNDNREVSEDSNDPEENGAPWPTFYNNVVGKVHKLLQGNHQTSSKEQDGDTPDDQYRTVQVRMATIDQFKKMGISFVDDSPNSKRVTFNKNKNKLNPRYDDNYQGAADGAKRSPLTAVCNTNLSFASLQYLQRYHLLPNGQTQGLFNPSNDEVNEED